MSSRRWNRKWARDAETDGFREQGLRPSLTQYGWVLDRC